MNRSFKFYTLFSVLLVAPILINKVNAQDVSDLIKSGKADATKLAQAYFAPAFKGFGFGMNSAWYNSAKAKNLGKFDLKIQATGALVPENDQSIRFSELGLSSNINYGAPNATSPTLFGKDEPGATITVLDNGKSFNMPKGSGFNIVPSPQLQLTVGLIKNTDISLRYTPKLPSDEYGSLQALGFGLKHEITKYILPGKTEKIIPINIAVAFGYNQLTYDYKVKVVDQLNDENPGVDQNQRVAVKLSGYTIDAVLSKKLSVFTPFISVGYNTAKTEFDVLGNYSFTDPTEDSGFTNVTDPITIRQTDIAGMRGNIGFSLHLAFLRLYGAYSIGEYQAVTGGIGFGIGK